MDKADISLRKRTVRIVSIFLIFIAVFSGVAIWWLFSAKLSIVAVRGNSMEPTFSNGDNVILKQIAAPAKDMIIVFKKPKTWAYMGDESRVLIKRIAATPGNVLKFDGESFIVNDEIIYSLSDDNYVCENGIVDYEHRLNKNQVFVLGDNPLESLDSRRIFCDGESENMYIGVQSVIDYGLVERVF